MRHNNEEPGQPWEDTQKSQFPLGSILILLSFTLMLFLEYGFSKDDVLDAKNEKIPVIILTQV